MTPLLTFDTDLILKAPTGAELVFKVRATVASRETVPTIQAAVNYQLLRRQKLSSILEHFKMLLHLGTAVSEVSHP